VLLSFRPTASSYTKSRAATSAQQLRTQQAQLCRRCFRPHTLGPHLAFIFQVDCQLLQAVECRGLGPAFSPQDAQLQVGQLTLVWSTHPLHSYLVFFVQVDCRLLQEVQSRHPGPNIELKKSSTTDTAFEISKHWILTLSLAPTQTLNQP
jgi:hypothetical protein